MTEPQPSPAGEPVPERDAAAAEPAGPSQPAQPAEAAADGAPAAPEPAAGLPEPADQPQAPPQPQPQLQPQPDVLPSTAGASSPAKPKAPKGGGAPKDKPASQQLASIKAELLFDKTLTMSDTNGQGRILIPKGPAAEHFPHIEFQSGVSVAFIDTLGNTYSLKFRYWANGAGKIYILEGTQQLQSRYNTHNGDSISFAKQANGTLVVCCSSSKPQRPGLGTPKQGKSRSGAKPGAQKEGAAGDGQPRKRGRPPNTTTVGRAQKQKGQLLQDGVFRAIPGLTSEQVAVLLLNGTWTATLDLAGEKYRAYFDSQDAAQEAYHAAGMIPA